MFPVLLPHKQNHRVFELAGTKILSSPVIDSLGSRGVTSGPGCFYALHLYFSKP